MTNESVLLASGSVSKTADSAAPGDHFEHLQRPSRILIVEGEELSRQLLAKALKNAGWGIDLADSQEAALAAFGNSSYAMVVIGTDRVNLDGFEIARRMRQAERPGLRTPIVALTGDNLQYDRKRRKAAGIDNYIAKPIRQHSLTSILARHVAEHAPSEDPRPQLAAVDERCIADLFRMLNGDGQQLQELLQAFSSDAVKLMDRMRSAEEDNDLASLWDAARGLKSMSAQVGASRIQSICSTVEAVAKSGSFSGVDALLQELSLANERVQADLRNVRPQAEGKTTGRVAQPCVPGTILVAESDALTARFLVTALTNNGYQPSHVTDGQQALNQIATRTFQILILNMALPGVDGIGILSQVRLRPEYAATPVVLLSSRGADHNIVRAFELGADDHISVPFNPLEVISRIQRLTRAR